MEFLPACFARRSGKLVGGGVDNSVANVALLNALQVFIDVMLPPFQTVNDANVLATAKQKSTSTATKNGGSDGGGPVSIG